MTGDNVNWINYHASFNKLLLRKSSQVKNIWIPYGSETQSILFKSKAPVAITPWLFLLENLKIA